MPADDRALRSLPCHYLLTRHARERPAATALIDGLSGASITYGELLPRVARLAAGLRARGLDAGDRIACLALNSKGYTELILAVAWLGAVLVPLNVRHSPKELRFILADSGAKALLTCPPLLPLAKASCADATSLPLRLIDGPAHGSWEPLEALADAPPCPANPAVTGASLFMLLYTSGTTGQPKGCMIAQQTWPSYATHMACCFQMSAADRYLAFLPFFHVAGFGTAFAQLILGGSIVTAPMADTALFYRLISQHRISIVFLVPGLSAAFLADPAQQATDVSSLRVFISGAGVEKLELVEAIERELGVRYYGIYGQTEAGGKVTWADAAMLRADPGSYGRVMPFYDYCLLDDREREVADGEIGELCLRGQGVMLGYWNQPEASADTLKGGWHHSGDLFVRQPDGLLKMVDRKKYLVKTGGENVYPQEVEQVLLAHPAVAEAAVIGVPDAQWGEAVKACLLLKPGGSVTPAEIAHWVGQHIAGYKKPRYVEIVDSIPRNASGKILKNELAARPVTPEQKV